MSSKRKNEDIPALSGREKKKQKTALARTIAVQPAAVGGSSASASNAEAGPSKGVRFNGMLLTANPLRPLTIPKMGLVVYLALWT